MQRVYVLRGAGGEMREVLGVGQRHPDTLTAMNNLASTLYELGKHVEAEAMGGGGAGGKGVLLA